MARGAEEREHRRPGERGPVGHAQLEAAVGDEAIGRAPAGPQLLGREPEDVLHHPVELADAVEPRRGARPCANGEVGVVEEAAGEVGAPAARDLGRGRADVNVEQPAQVARAHAEAGRERVLGGVVERAVGDGAQGPAHELGRLDPAGHGFAIGPAA